MVMAGRDFGPVKAATKSDQRIARRMKHWWPDQRIIVLLLCQCVAFRNRASPLNWAADRYGI